jgi:hypothetical protein
MKARILLALLLLSGASIAQTQVNGTGTNVTGVANLPAGWTSTSSGATQVVTDPGSLAVGATALIADGLQPVNVMAAAYGAKGDGVTDDTAAIQAAINAAFGHSGEVWFPSPSVRYLIASGPAILKTGVSLRGVMPQTTYIAANVPEGTMQPAGGTWFDCHGGTCFSGSGLRGVNVNRLGFQNFGATAINLGGNGIDGIAFSNWRDLQFYGNPTCCSSDTAIAVTNFAGFGLERINATAVNTLVRATSQNSYDQPGNSVWIDLMAQTYPKSAANGNNTASKAGLVFTTAAPTSGSALTLDYITVIRPQIQLSGGDYTGSAISLIGGPAGVSGIGIYDADLEGAWLYGFNLSNAYNNYLGTLITAQSASSWTYNLDSLSAFNTCFSTYDRSTVQDASGSNMYYGAFWQNYTNMSGAFRSHVSGAFGTAGTFSVGGLTNTLSMPGTGDTIKATGALFINSAGNNTIFQSNGTSMIQLLSTGMFFQGSTNLIQTPSFMFLNAATNSMNLQVGGSTTAQITSGGLYLQTGKAFQVPSIKATTGTRYVCVDTSGNITSSAAVCSGT